MAEPVRILIVDDHAIVREGLRAIFEAESGFRVVGLAGKGAEALDRFLELAPDVTLLDVHFHGENGLDILREIRRRRPKARVLMISTYDHDEDVFQALQLGARGFLLKETGAQELVAAIRTVHEGGRSIPKWAGHKLAERAGIVELSDREREVLQHLADGLANKEIGAKLGVSEGTIKAHLSHIFDKLGVTDRTQAVLVALRRGIVHLD